VTHEDDELRQAYLEKEIVALTRYERGDALSAEDLAINGRYDKLRVALAQRTDALPSEGWEARVLRGIDAGSGRAVAAAATARATPAPPRRWARGTIGAAAALAAAAVLLLWLWRRPETLAPATFALATEVLRGEAQVRGDEPAVGDRLLVKCQAHARYVEIRVYRDDRVLVLRCPGAPGCTRDQGGARAELLVAAPGTYRAVLFAADAPLPEPRAEGLDADVGAAGAAGAKVITGKAVSVF
jgi:hypothetical protein